VADERLGSGDSQRRKLGQILAMEGRLHQPPPQHGHELHLPLRGMKDEG
jgi:hypothetical protein